MSNASDFEKQAPEGGHGHQVEITVNFKLVHIEGPTVTGLAIKEAAIAQGVNIKLDFVLFEELGHGKRRVIGDHDKVEVHKGSKFEAIPNDDNS